MSASGPADDRVGRMQDQMVGRRTFLKAAGATGAVVATGGIGSVAAAGEYNPSSEYSPLPRVTDTINFEEHDRAAASDHFYFVNDSGEDDSLTNYGASLAPRADEDPDVDDTPHNPVSVRADKIEDDDYEAFPRDEQYDEDGDGSADTDVTALAATHWTKDVSGSAGTMSIADERSPAGGPGLRISTSSQTSGDVAEAVFSDFTIDSGIDRRRLFLVFNVTSVDTGATVQAVATDGAGTEKVKDIATNGTGNGQVVQVALGDLANDLSVVEDLRFRISDANADIHFVGIDLERDRHVKFGEKEQLDADDNIETVDVEEPTGRYSITGLPSMDDIFGDAVLEDVEVDTELHLERLPSDYLYHEVVEAERYTEDHLMDLVVNFKLPDPFDLGWNTPSIDDTVQHPSARYESVAYTSDSDPVTVKKIDGDDKSYSWTTVTSRYDKDMDTDVTVQSSVTPAGDYHAVHYEVLLYDGEKSDLFSGSTSGATGPADTRSGGMLPSWVFSWPSMLVGSVGLAALIRKVTNRGG